MYLFTFPVPARLNCYVLFLPGNTSGTGVLAEERLYSTQRILHWSWS